MSADSSARLPRRQGCRTDLRGNSDWPAGCSTDQRREQHHGRRPKWSASERKDSNMNEAHDVDVLNQGLHGEYCGITAYDAALASGLLSDKVGAVARQFQADHRAHAQAIRQAIERLGGRADAPKTWKEYAALYPPPKLASEADVLRYAA